MEKAGSQAPPQSFCCEGTNLGYTADWTCVRFSLFLVRASSARGNGGPVSVEPERCPCFQSPSSPDKLARPAEQSSATDIRLECVFRMAARRSPNLAVGNPQAQHPFQILRIVFAKHEAHAIHELTVFRDVTRKHAQSGCQGFEQGKRKPLNLPGQHE